MAAGTTGRNIVIAGGSGFVGTALARSLRDNGHTVTILTRGKPASADQSQWDPQRRVIAPGVIESADAVVNLAGASIAGGYWTQQRKHQILQSRLDATRTLAEAIAAADSKPAVFVSASAVGFYGDRPGEELTEQAQEGDGFLADVCRQWEGAADVARVAGVRVVHPRFGLVLSGEGGMLPIMKWPFRLGLGGKIGGAQHMAWVDLRDLVRILRLAIESDGMKGPVNAVAPTSTTNAQFTRAMGEALNRPTVIPIPAKLASLAGGELVRELLLPDQHVIPGVLQDSGFAWDRPTIYHSLAAAFRQQER